MADSLPVIELSDGGYALLKNPYGGLQVRVTPDGTTDCCCTCDGFPKCLHRPAVVEYRSSQDVDWPDGVTKADIECWGQGGKGGSATKGTSGDDKAGGGGGGGGYGRAFVFKGSETFLRVRVNETGEDTTVERDTSGTVVCRGYNGANGGDADDTTPQATDGTGDSGGGDLAHTGGDGADGNSTAGYGGGGGGGAGTAQDGFDGFGQTGGKGGVNRGGKGGKGGDAAAVAQNGDDYGGGGGGALIAHDSTDTSHNGGAGGKGHVRITWHHPIELDVTLQGGQDFLCETDLCPDDGEYSAWNLLFGNLNGSYTLKQCEAGTGTFYLNLIDGSCQPLSASNDCDDCPSGGAVLVEQFRSRDCEGNYYLQNGDVYVIGIRVSLQCSEGRMSISSLSLDFCQRQLFSLVDPEYEDECIMYFGPYGVCYPIRYVYVGDVIDDAVPCSQQTMTSELKWPDIHFYAEDPPPPSKHHPCSSGYYCEEEDIIGQITANVVP